MESMNQFDEIKSSALKELANVGISHVATTIGEISKEKVDISLPEIDDFSKQQLFGFGKQNGGVITAYFTVEGISDLAEVFIILKTDDAFELMNKFVNVETASEVNMRNYSKEEQRSVFLEVSTVITATYFSAVDSMFNLKTHYGIPQVSFSNAELSNIINEKLQHDQGISIRASFTSTRSNLKGEFLLISSPKNLDRFFKAIGLMA